MPELTGRRAQVARAVAIAIAVLIPLGLLLAWVFVPIPECRDAHWVLQTAGTVARADAVDVGGPGCDVGTSLVVDLVFILGYIAIFTWLIDRGGRRMRSRPGRRFVARLRWLPAVAGLFDVIENALMAQWALPDGYSADWEARWVAAVAMPKTALLLIVLATVAGAIWALADDS